MINKLVGRIRDLASKLGRSVYALTEYSKKDIVIGNESFRNTEEEILVISKKENFLGRDRMIGPDYHKAKSELQSDIARVCFDKYFDKYGIILDIEWLNNQHQLFLKDYLHWMENKPNENNGFWSRLDDIIP